MREKESSTEQLRQMQWNVISGEGADGRSTMRGRPFVVGVDRITG